MEQIIVDIGSGKTKVYELKNDGVVKPLFDKRIDFKRAYNSETGLSAVSKQTLFQTINEIKVIAGGKPINIYATSVFRIMPAQMLDNFKAEFQKETGIVFNVLSQQEENRLMTLSVKNLNIAEKYLAACIGNGSTEMAILHNGTEKESFTIEHARADLMKEFQLSNDVCTIPFDELCSYVDKIFTFPKTSVKYLVVLGGNGLSYSKKSDFFMEKNTVFNNDAIPVCSNFDNFVTETKRLLLNDSVSLAKEELEMFRSHCVIACCIMKAVAAENIFMTDLNLVDGIAKDLANKKITMRDNYAKI